MSEDKQKAQVDPEIMAELLRQPEIAKEIAGMPPDVVDYYKELLVSQGIYDRYVQERQQKGAE